MGVRIAEKWADEVVVSYPICNKTMFIFSTELKLKLQNQSSKKKELYTLEIQTI